VSVPLSDLANQATRLLGLIQAALVQYGVPIPVDENNAPVAYVSPGSEFAWDAPSLVVNLGPLTFGRPGATSGRLLPTEVTTSGSFIIWLVREASVVQNTGPPQPTEIAADFARSAADMLGMAQAIFEVYSEYQFTSMGEDFILREIVPLGPEGNLMAVRATIEVGLS
jgi:hypothetical protein